MVVDSLKLVDFLGTVDGEWIIRPPQIQKARWSGHLRRGPPLKIQA